MLVRRLLKSYIAAICLFLMLTLVLAAVIRFTAFDEDWAYAGLIVAMSVSTLFLGMMAGLTTGKRGLFVGTVAATCFIAIILLAVDGIFAAGFHMKRPDVLYIVPVLAGTVGGILGANRNKS